MLCWCWRSSSVEQGGGDACCSQTRDREAETRTQSADWLPGYSLGTERTARRTGATGSACTAQYIRTKVDCVTFSVLDTNLLTRCCVQVAWQNGKDSFFLSSPVAVLRPLGATMAMGGKAWQSWSLIFFKYLKIQPIKFEKQFSLNTREMMLNFLNVLHTDQSMLKLTFEHFVRLTCYAASVPIQCNSNRPDERWYYNYFRYIMLKCIDFFIFIKIINYFVACWFYLFCLAQTKTENKTIRFTRTEPSWLI